jgi:hypothetical protein
MEPIPTTARGSAAAGGPVEAKSAAKLIRHFRQILLWPLQLMPIRAGSQIQKHWEMLRQASADNPWRELADEFTGDAARFQERHYNEFVTFLPQVQRFLYGEGMGREARAWLAESPIRVFRRSDLAAVRITYDDNLAPAIFRIAHVDLYFFFDIDVAVLALEVHADDLSLERAQDTLYRLGRAYPLHWDAGGQAANCLRKVEWLSASGAVLATSDFEQRDRYLSFVRQHRAPCIAAHWEFVLRPLVHHDSDQPGPIRYRHLEYHRMPVAAYLAIDDPHVLTRTDFIRLALLVGPGGAGKSLPFSEQHLRDFEARYCYDRDWSDKGGHHSTRFLCGGSSFMVVGDHGNRAFADAETGVLGQFRHQYFLLFLIAHFHKAALLMLSERLVESLHRLDISDADSVKRFKRAIRQVFEIFLRFTHRYWFHDVSLQVQPKELFRMCCEHLGNDRLYEEVREEIEDMSNYLDSDSLRRQSNTVVRLTVITTLGLIATVTTGFLGMNLIAAAGVSLAEKLLYFGLVLAPTVFLTFFAVLRSKRLSDFMEALSDERLPPRAKLAALARVWRE